MSRLFSCLHVLKLSGDPMVTSFKVSTVILGTPNKSFNLGSLTEDKNLLEQNIKVLPNA